MVNRKFDFLMGDVSNLHIEGEPFSIEGAIKDCYQNPDATYSQAGADAARDPKLVLHINGSYLSLPLGRPEGCTDADLSDTIKNFLKKNLNIDEVQARNFTSEFHQGAFALHHHRLLVGMIGPHVFKQQMEKGDSYDIEADTVYAKLNGFNEGVSSILDLSLTDSGNKVKVESHMFHQKTGTIAKVVADYPLNSGASNLLIKGVIYSDTQQELLNKQLDGLLTSAGFVFGGVKLNHSHKSKRAKIKNWWAGQNPEGIISLNQVAQHLHKLLVSHQESMYEKFSSEKAELNNLVERYNQLENSAINDDQLVEIKDRKNEIVDLMLKVDNQKLELESNIQKVMDGKTSSEKLTIDQLFGIFSEIESMQEETINGKLGVNSIRIRTLTDQLEQMGEKIEAVKNSLDLFIKKSEQKVQDYAKNRGNPNSFWASQRWGSSAKAANIKEAVDELKRGVASGEVKSLDHPLVEEVVSQMNKARILSESKMGTDQIQAEEPVNNSV